MVTTFIATTAAPPNGGRAIRFTTTLVIFFFVLTLLPPLQAYASNPPAMKWNMTFGGSRPEMACRAQQTIDGGYFIAGYTSSFGSGGDDFWLVKTDSNGNVKWNKTYGGTKQDQAFAAQQTTDTGYILAGSTSSAGAGLSDLWVVKTDTNGQKLWDRTYGGTLQDAAYCIRQTPDGGYILAGTTSSFGLGYEDFWLLKTDSNGYMQWNRTYGGIYDDSAYSVQQTTDGGYIVCGYTGSFGAGYEDLWLVKTDSNGDAEWNKTYGGTESEYGYSVQQTDDEGYILVGSAYSLSTGFDILLVKTDSFGNMQWNRTYGGLLDEEAYTVQQTQDNGYIVGGFTESSGNRDIYLIKTDWLGNVEWSETYGGGQKDEAYSIEQTSDGGFVVAGTTSSFGESWDPDFWLIRLAGLHDISIQNAEPDKTAIGQGYAMHINVTVKNWGASEVFNLTLFVNTTSLETQFITLSNADFANIIFTWTTNTYTNGHYNITIAADTVSGETDTMDNIETLWIAVTFPGDVNGDLAVDIYDAIALAGAYDSVPQTPSWNPNADINSDNIVDIYDAIILSSTYGQKI